MAITSQTLGMPLIQFAIYVWLYGEAKQFGVLSARYVAFVASAT